MNFDIIWFVIILRLGQDFTNFLVSDYHEFNPLCFILWNEVMKV